MKIFIDKLKNKQDLSFNESKNAFEILMDGKASAVEILSVFIPSPPVPHVSIQSLTLTLLDLFLST